MLTILGENSGSFCDGHSRRDFLQIGGLALGGASLPQLLQAESSLGKSSRGINHKAVIMIMLPGGPPAPGYVGPENGRSERIPR